jgi:hypothetical protein
MALFRAFFATRRPNLPVIFHPHIGAMINKISTKQIKRSGKRILVIS